MDNFNNEEQKKLAQKIWDMPFACSNLHKLTKKELLILIEAILFDVSYKNEEWRDLDIKDILFEEKCWIIKCLDENFFQKKNNCNSDIVGSLHLLPNGEA